MGSCFEISTITAWVWAGPVISNLLHCCISTSRSGTVEIVLTRFVTIMDSVKSTFNSVILYILVNLHSVALGSSVAENSQFLTLESTVENIDRVILKVKFNFTFLLLL